MARPLVLVVQDDPILADALCLMVGGGTREALACTEAEAVTTARDARPHLIIIEADKWASYGIAISKDLRADPVTADVPIIALTATANRDHYPGLCADELLRMPFHLHELLAAVAHWAAPVETPVAESHESLILAR